MKNILAISAILAAGILSLGAPLIAHQHKNVAWRIRKTSG